MSISFEALSIFNAFNARTVRINILADILRQNGMSDFYINDFLTENFSIPLYALYNESRFMGASAITSKKALDVAFNRIKIDYPDMQSMYMMKEIQNFLIMGLILKMMPEYYILELFI